MTWRLLRGIFFALGAVFHALLRDVFAAKVIFAAVTYYVKKTTHKSASDMMQMRAL